MKIVKPPLLVRALFPKAIWKVTTQEKVVFLTFDDGPVPIVTEQVLDLLKQYNAKATFFCIGNNVRKYSIIYQRILTEGHSVGNHTYHHLKGTKTNNQVYLKDIEQCAQVVQSKLFRPPYGRMKINQYNQLKQNYNIVLWDVLSWDFDSKTTPIQCTKNVLNNVQNGSIVVFHDSLKAKENCLYALEQTLKELSKQGFRFKRLTYKS